MPPIRVLILGHSFIRRLNDFLHSWFGCHDTRVKQKVRSVSGILKINLVELNKLQTEIVIIDPKPHQSTHFSYTVKRIECSAKVPPFCSNYQNNSTSSPSFLGQRFNNQQEGCTLEVILTSSVQYDKIISKFGKQQLVNYAYGFNQSETGKYFEWMIL